MNDKHGLKGFALLHDALHNKATAFTYEERERLGLTGLLPSIVSTQDYQVSRVMANLRNKHSDIERYIFLRSLQHRNERLFYRVVIDHISEVMPLIYTPTVGEACREFAHIYRNPRGMYISPREKGKIRRVLDNWPQRDVRVVVVTDGARILGLGDLGANGMGIPIGKLALYVACAGIHPQQCLPIVLDVGTNNQELIDDPVYLGIREERLGGDAYLELVDEFVDAVQDAYPEALIQFEDFATPNAISLLKRHRDRVLCFNDDIQGTAAVALAGVYAAGRISRVDFRDVRVLFLGAGSAATGIGELMLAGLIQAGVDRETALARLWFVDSKGLVTRDREQLAEHKRLFAQASEPLDFHGAMDALRPNVLIGATGSPGTFDEPIIRKMAALNERPTIFALSNPTSRAECTAQEAYEFSDGRAVFASGSPFDPVTLNGRHFRPGQGNNVYIFPGVGLGAQVSGARVISDTVFATAARALADQITETDLAAGSVYPPLTDIRRVSVAVATAVAEQIYAEGVARVPRPDDLASAIAGAMFQPGY